ncbi:hypothetical protein RSAG8_00571, partial [Rhizoctonia solani AG-8 WAC10335]
MSCNSDKLIERKNSKERGDDSAKTMINDWRYRLPNGGKTYK